MARLAALAGVGLVLLVLTQGCASDTGGEDTLTGAATSSATSIAHTPSPSDVLTATPDGAPSPTPSAIATPRAEATATPTTVPTSPPPEATSTSTAAPTATATPTSTASAQPTAPPTGEVGVTTEKSTYRRGETVVVHIANGSSELVRGQTGQTYCTIVSVQRNVGGEWQMQGRCVAAGGPPGFVPIEAGGEMTVEVFPRYPSDKELVAGQYRIEFVFLLGSTSDSPQTVHSEEFTVVE